jgi:hypothetical protein
VSHFRPFGCLIWSDLFITRIIQIKF